ncbi:MAG: SpoIIE family protein phosphatase, partial [Bdellovibrio sp.]|nr:SpoIIE family protein phosphatase [Bdellovibrio sp.]
CSELDFEEVRQGRVAIIVNELGNNLVRYASKSQLIFRKVISNCEVGIEILSIDSGPGMDDTITMQDGYSTGTTPGTGLGSVKRQSDFFDIYSAKDKGTIVVSRVFSKKYSALESVKHLQVGAINFPMSSETVSGDSWCVHETAQGVAVLVSDGLGHGPAAHEASVRAVEIFSNHFRSPVEEILQTIHVGLKGTRGAAIFLLSSNQESVTFVGAGNICAAIQSASKAKTLISQNGTAGLQVSRSKSVTQEWNQTGYLIFHSDGILGRWNLSVYPGILRKHPSILAGVLFRDFARCNDDATILVIRRPA